MLIKKMLPIRVSLLKDLVHRVQKNLNSDGKSVRGKEFNGLIELKREVANWKQVGGGQNSF